MNNIYFYKLCGNLYHNFRIPNALYRIIPIEVKDTFSNWLYDNSFGIKICDECGDLLSNCTFSGNRYRGYQYYPEDAPYSDVDVSKVVDGWHEIFIHVCYHLDINKKSAEVLWNNLAYGNWEHLHQTEEEENYSEEEWFKNFYYDVLYCSDRWSLDRLERCHWQFRQWIRKTDYEFTY